VGQAHLSGQMSGQAAQQMNQVGGGAGNGVVGTDGMPLQQQMQMQDNAGVGLGNGWIPSLCRCATVCARGYLST